MSLEFQLNVSETGAVTSKNQNQRLRLLFTISFKRFSAWLFINNHNNTWNQNSNDALEGCVFLWFM